MTHRTPVLPPPELIRAARLGDAAAAEALFSTLHGALERYLSGRLPSPVRAVYQTDDLVQDVCARAWKGLASFDRDSPAAFWGYLRTIAHNLVIDISRRELRRREDPLAAQVMATPEDPKGCDIIELLARQELYERALAELDKPLREALLLRLEVGTSYEELAPLLQVPSAEAARKKLRRALDSLLQYLSSEDRASV